MAKKQTATFLGGQLGISTIGEHAYAYSGQFPTGSVQSLTDMLNFTTGDYYLVGEWTVCGSVNLSSASDTGALDQFYLSYNSITIQSLKTDTQQEDSPTLYTIPIMIPPRTVVICQGISSLNNDSWRISQSIAGRIYNA